MDQGALCLGQPIYTQWTMGLCDMAIRYLPSGGLKSAILDNLYPQSGLWGSVYWIPDIYRVVDQGALCLGQLISTQWTMGLCDMDIRYLPSGGSRSSVSWTTYIHTLDYGAL